MTHTLDTPTTTLDTTTDTMRAAVVTEFGAPLEISDLELPTPGFGEALVKVETSGVLLCDMDIGAVLLPMGDVVRRRPKKALRGRQVTGHYPRQRVGQASNQPPQRGRAGVAAPTGWTNPGKSIRCGRHTIHESPPARRQHRSCQASTGPATTNNTNGSAPRIGRGLGGPQVGSEDFVADSGRRHAA